MHLRPRALSFVIYLNSIRNIYLTKRKKGKMIFSRRGMLRECNFLAVTRNHACVIRFKLCPHFRAVFKLKLAPAKHPSEMYPTILFIVRFGTFNFYFYFCFFRTPASLRLFVFNYLVFLRRPLEKFSPAVRIARDLFSNVNMNQPLVKLKIFEPDGKPTAMTIALPLYQIHLRVRTYSRDVIQRVEERMFRCRTHLHLKIKKARLSPL